MGGTGDAFNDAIANEGFVSKVEWYTFPLDGLVGDIGGCHSLLAIEVTDKDGNKVKYTLEKAMEPPEPTEAYKHGVYISKWDDVRMNIVATAIKTLNAENIKPGLKMR